MAVVVKLRPDLAAAVRTGNAHEDADPQALLKPFNLSLQPMHANRPTGPLSTYFVVDAPGHLAEVVRSQLSRIGGVENAYIEPPPSVPGKP